MADEMVDEKPEVNWTEAGITALKPTGKREQFTDPDTGMVLLMTPKGCKTYYLVYRPDGGRSAPRRWFKIGTAKKIGLEAARKKHKKHAGEVADGKDPQADRKAQRMDRATVNELCDRYERDYLDAGEVAESTSIGYKQHLKAHIRPSLGGKVVRAVTTGDVAAFLKAIPTKGQRNKVRATGSRLFSRAELWGWREKGTNPFTGQDKADSVGREVRLDDDQIRALGAYLKTGAEPAEATACIVVLLCSGMRVSEFTGEPRKKIPAPEWADFKLKDRVLWLRHHKTVKKIGPKPVYLCPQLAAYIHALPRNGDAILGGWHNGTKAWPKIAKAAGIKGVTLHDLRHAFTSIGDDLGFSEATRGALVGHAASSMTGRYTHKLSKDLQAAADAIGGHIWGLLGL
jgi:integrase